MDSDQFFLGEKLKKIREEKGLSMSELHRRSGLSVSYIHYLETGKNEPTVTTLLRLCKALDVAPSYFLGED